MKHWIIGLLMAVAGVQGLTAAANALDLRLEAPSDHVEVQAKQYLTRCVPSLVGITPYTVCTYTPMPDKYAEVGPYVWVCAYPTKGVPSFEACSPDLGNNH